MIAEALGNYHCYRSKYHASHIAQWLPIVNQQGNAFVTRDTIQNEQFHYFEKGVKRLVIEWNSRTSPSFWRTFRWASACGTTS